MRKRRSKYLIVVLVLCSLVLSIQGKDIKEYKIDKGCYITLADDIIGKLQDKYFEAYLEFEYWDEDYTSIEIKGASNKTAQFGNFEQIAQVHKTDTKQWQPAKIRLYSENIILDHQAENNSDIVVKGEGKIRNIKITFTTFMPNK